MHTDSTTKAVSSPTLAAAAQAGYDEALSFVDRYIAIRDGKPLCDAELLCLRSYLRGARPGSFAADAIAREAVAV